MRQFAPAARLLVRFTPLLTVASFSIANPWLGTPRLSGQASLPGQDSGPVCEDRDEPRFLLDESFFYVATAEEVTECIEAGLDVTRPGLAGDTPLHMASAHSGDTAVINVLLRAGAEVGARGNSGATPLHATASRNDRDNAADPTGCDNWNTRVIGRTLLESGADVQARDGSGRTPLHAAAEGWTDRPAIASVLVAAGAEVHARDDSGRTPLHLAALRNPAVFPTLLRLGADPGACDDADKTPLDYARDNRALQGLEVVRESWNDGR